MFGLGVPELVIILVVVLLFFGPRKLPELGNFLGKSLRDFREALENRDEPPEDPEAGDQPKSAGNQDLPPGNPENDRREES